MSLLTMVETKRPSVDELITSMNEYIKELDNMNEKNTKNSNRVSYWNGCS